MRRQINIFISAILLLLSSITLCYSQIDTLAVIKINNVEYSNNKLSFDLRIKRNSEQWLAFANGTFQLTFQDTNFKYDNSQIYLEIKSSQLEQFSQIGSELPVTDYLIEPKVFDNRISITIVGPEKFEDCILIPNVPSDTTILLGRFTIAPTGSQILPGELRWLEPYPWYQACAYKLQQDSIIPNTTIRMFYADDNIAMDDGVHTTFVFEYEKSKERFFEFDDFWVVYTGQKVDSIGWKTRFEKDVVGYYLMRGFQTDVFAVEYKTLIGTYRGESEKFNPFYISKGFSDTGHVYYPVFDTVDYRGGEYCYGLFATMVRKDGTQFDTLLAQKCVTIPNAVISKANPAPNPFQRFTTIQLVLDDDCYVDGFITDQQGKLVEILQHDGQPISKLKMKKSGKKDPNKPDDSDNRIPYEIDFDAGPVASQGLYNAVFIAYPINDINVEMSRAVVKLQLLKNNSAN